VYYTSDARIRYNYTIANLIPGEKYEWRIIAASRYSTQYNFTRLPLRLGEYNSSEFEKMFATLLKKKNNHSLFRQRFSQHF